MTGNRSTIIIGVVTLLLALNGLACSFSGEVDLGGATATFEADEEKTATPTESPAESTSPPPAETLPPAEPTALPETKAPQPTESPVTEEPAPPPPPPVEVPADQEPLEAAEIPELTVTTLDPQGAGLGNLGTFRQRMTLSFVAEGSAYTGDYNYEAEIDTSAQAIHVTVSAEGAAAMELPANSLQVLWIGNQAWFKIGNQPWLPYPESVQALPFDEQVFSVSSFLPYVQYFQRVDERVVNDISCAHYTYEAQGLPTQYGTVNGHGDICVALDGGYVVHYTLDGTGTFEDYFEGSGTLQIVYDTYDVGADIVIEPPRRG
jgi:hypothetical protein